MLGMYARRWIPFDEEIEVSQEHFRGAVGTDYNTPLQRLKSAGIIKTDDVYYYPSEDDKSAGMLGRCKRYTFNPDYIFSDPAIFEMDAKSAALHDRDDEAVKLTLPVLRSVRLDIDKRSINAWLKSQVTETWVQSQCTPGHKLPEGKYKVRGVDYPMPLDKIRAIAGRREFWLYKEDRIYIADGIYKDLDTFVNRHTKELRMLYAQKVCELKNLRSNAAIYCSRNNTNFRLDHNLTNTRAQEPANILALRLCPGEHRVNIDLKNSQFTLLSIFLQRAKAYVSAFCANNDVIERKKAAAKHDLSSLSLEGIQVVSILSSMLASKENPYINVTKVRGGEGMLNVWFSEDLDTLKTLTKSGKFYDVLAEKLTIETGKMHTRKDGKQTAFEVLFSAARNNTPEKEILRKYWPAFVHVCDVFKLAHIDAYEAQGRPRAEALDFGNASLAVFLQRIESGIFVDRILIDLLRRGYRVLSKHDSILCKPSELPEVLAFVRAHLDNILGEGEYVLSVEG